MRRPGDPGRPRQGTAQHAGHPAAQSGHPDAAARRRAGRTQQGNNNVYAQDNELSWIDWTAVDTPLYEFTASLVRLRRAHPTFRRRRFFTGTSVRTEVTGSEGDRLNDIVWLGPDGEPLRDAAWDDGSQVLGMYLNGQGIAGTDARGGRIIDDHFLLYFNAGPDAELTLPGQEYAEMWDVVLDTGSSADSYDPLKAGSCFVQPACSVVLLREHRPDEPAPDRSVAASVAALITTR